MSNIPYNTVASVLGSSSVQQQAAAAIDRGSQAVARAQRIQQQKNDEHNEQVEDPADDAVDGVHDRQQKSAHDQRGKSNRQAAAEVDISGVEARIIGPPPAREEREDLDRLDISA